MVMVPLEPRTATSFGIRCDMPLIKSATRKAIGQNIETEQNAGKPHRQAIAIALDVARRNKRRKGGRLRRADGGEALSDTDQAAMMPETYANPAVDHLIRNTAAIPKRAIEAASNYQPGQPETYDPAPIVDAAMLPMGTGAIAGVPVRAGEAVLGAGPIRHIYHSTAPENAASIAQKGLMPRGEGTYFAPNERMAKAWHTEGNALYRVDPEKVKGLQSETGGLSPAETDSLLTHSKVPPSALDVSADAGKTWEPVQKIDWSPGGGSKTAKLGETSVDYGISKDGKTGEIILVKTPKASRGQGEARAAMQRMVDEADNHGTTLFLNADPMDKGVSKSGLERFYKSLGFVKNMGRNKDFSSRAEFVRQPKAEEKASGGTVRNPAVTRALAVARRAKGGKIAVGPIKGDDGGRTDVHEAKVHDGGYILNADTISHMGESNSQAGLKRAQEIFGIGGHYDKSMPDHREDGGKVENGKPIECILAGGEFSIHPRIVRKIGRGDIDLGHKILDKFSMDTRRDHIKVLASLPPPARD